MRHQNTSTRTVRSQSVSWSVGGVVRLSTPGHFVVPEETMARVITDSGKHSSIQPRHNVLHNLDVERGMWSSGTLVSDEVQVNAHNTRSQ